VVGKPRAAKKKTGSPIIAEMIRDMQVLVATLEAGGMAAVEKKFRVTRLQPPAAPPAFDAKGVQAVRAELRASQPLFAALLGVSPATVRAWEQGQKKPSGMARRFLDEIRRDPDYWRKRLLVTTTRNGK
jgi:putative transcriptional regulator